MKIEIVPVAESISSLNKVKQAERGSLRGHMRHSTECRSSSPTTGKAKLCVPLSHEPSLLEAIEPAQSEVVTLEDIFARFLQLEVGDGDASNDTIRNYLSQTKQYLNWCDDNLLSPLEAEPADIKLYRQYLVQSEYANSTIATKLNIVRIFYNAAQAHGLIATNPAAKVKAPKDRKDPAARITFLEPEELKFLLDYIQSQLDKAKTNKQKLILLRDRILIGIMSLEGCRTVEMHQLKVADIVRQGIKTGLQVSAKRASRIVPLTKNLASWLDEYLQMRRKVLRRKIKPESYVFVSLSNNSKNQQLSRRSIRAIIDRYLVECNLKHTDGRTLSAHSLKTYCWYVGFENWFGFETGSRFARSCRSTNYFYLCSCRRSLG